MEERDRLGKGGLTPRARVQAARRVSGEAEGEGILAQLRRISGPEYFTRIQDRDVARLSDFAVHIRAGNDQIATRILGNAISKLWRVVEEKTKREKGEREK